MKKISRKWVIAILVGTLAVGGGSVAKQRVESSKIATEVTTAQVTREDFVNTISSSGKTSAEKSVELKFQTSGRLAWVGVKEGDTVGAYQAIAGLDAREVQKNLEKVLIDYSMQRNTFEDTRKYNFPADKPEDALNERMRHLLEANQWDLNKAILDVELRSLAVEYSTLVTPIAGVVTHIDTPIAGINITPATSVFAVADLSSIVFEANVDEIDVGSLAVGQPVSISLDAFPEATFSGKVSFVSYASQTSSGGATVFPVKIAFDAPGTLRIGLNGDVNIELNRSGNVLVVPTEAVREEKGRQYVYKKTGDVYEKAFIETGAKNENDTVVTGGLQEGDTVVTKGFTSISAKAK